jgi:hypothetical protein
MKRLSFNHTTNVAKCTICALFYELVNCKSKVVNGFSAPFKLVTFKKHDKSCQHLKSIDAKNALSVPEFTPLAASMKKFDHKMFIVFSTFHTI